MTDCKSSEEVFRAIKKPKLLNYIADHRKMDLTDKQKKHIVKHLSEDVFNTGLTKILMALKKKTLEDVAAKLDWEGRKEGSKHPSKIVLCKKIAKQAERDGAKEFFKGLSSSVQNSVINDLYEEDERAAIKDMSRADAIAARADQFGLEHCLSLFSAKELQDFCRAAKLEVETVSIEHLIESLMKLEDYTPPKKKKKEVKASKKKPEIKKGINKVDLQNWYTHTELSQYCEDQDIIKSGNKKELIQRIIDLHNGKKIPKKGENTRKRKADSEKGKKQTKKQRKSAETSESEDESSEEESDDKKKKKNKKNKKSSDKSEGEKSEKDKSEKEGKGDKEKGDKGKETGDKGKDKTEKEKGDKGKEKGDKGKETGEKGKETGDKGKEKGEKGKETGDKKGDKSGDKGDKKGEKTNEKRDSKSEKSERSERSEKSDKSEMDESKSTRDTE